ncbi:MAG: citrate/2-methylcitrate synthase [Myxococcota bacterium]|jgi:citrate synthase
MENTKPHLQAVRGLEKVVAADTRISFVDGDGGRLFYRGYNIDELAGRTSFEEAVYLCWYGELPNSHHLAAFRGSLVSEMRLPAQVTSMLELAPPNANPMVVLRTAVSALGMFDPDGGTNSPDANERKSRRLLAQTSTIIAVLHRLRCRKPIISPDPRAGFAANFFYTFHGRMPTPLEERALDTTLLLHCDHGLAASTFSARVTCSTLAGMHSALTAALATLKGPLHGGANRAAMEMLEEIGGPGRVEEYINGMLSDGQRVMGFGHRVYKTEDPRTKHLRQLSEQLCETAGLMHLHEISAHIEKVVLARKGIYPNVDFYSATTQAALGIPKEFYTTIFSAARTSGWIAHIIEQFSDNRLIRPTSNYIGGYDRKWVPIPNRA